MKKLLAILMVATLSIIFGTTAAHAATADNFTISSYTVDMTLSRDGERRSTLSVTETITAQFPAYDQNHGLERAFVTKYDDHTLSLQVTGVTDENNTTLPYHWSGDTIRIGDADTYVHGTQTYVITYTMRDVTRYYSDTDADEFYWDVIGTDWKIPIERSMIALTINSSILDSLSGATGCYMGSAGSQETCTLEETGAGFTTEIDRLAPRQGVTIAIGFTKGTFAVYQPSLTERLMQLWAAVQAGATILALGAGIWFAFRWYSRLYRPKDIGTIVPEYLPPESASVTSAARVGGYHQSIMTAQLLDLAVRHYIKIYEAKEKTFFSPAEYEIEVIRAIDDLRWEEQEILKDTFGTTPTPGQRLNLKKLQNNTAYYSRTLNNDTDLDVLIRGDYNFRALDIESKKWARKVAVRSCIVAVLLLSPLWVIVALVAFIASFTAYRLTDNGVALRRYLKGLRHYIEVAEKDRIAMLQSPEGAEKLSHVVKGAADAQLVKLYERVLPYAVLFGQEKQWNAQLGRYYEAGGTNPDWYTGHSTVFNAAVFSSAMSSFSQSNTYVSSGSSSSGGSGGGGSSGGGGGGGGGGGW